MTEAQVTVFKALLEDLKVKEVKALRDQLLGVQEGDPVEQLTNYLGTSTLFYHIPKDAPFEIWRRVLLNDHHLMKSFSEEFWEQVNILFKASGIQPMKNNRGAYKLKLLGLKPEGDTKPVYYKLVSQFEDVMQTNIGELLDVIENALPSIDREVQEAYNSYPAEFLNSPEPVVNESEKDLYDTPIEDKERAKEHKEVAHITLPNHGGNFIWLNHPQDPKAHDKILPKAHRIEHRNKRDQITHHYSLNCNNEESLRESVQATFKKEFAEGNGIFKANIVFVHTIETPLNEHVYSYQLIKAHPQFQYRAPTYIRQERQEEDFEKFDTKINDDLRYLYAVRYSTSAVKPICVCQALLVIYTVKAVGGKVILPDVLAKSHRENIITYVNDYNLCFWVAAYTHLFWKERMHLEKHMGKVKSLCCEFYGEYNLGKDEKDHFIRFYPGFNIEEEMSTFINKYKTNVLIYKPTNKQYTEFKISDKFIYDSKSDNTMKLLLMYLPLATQPEIIVPHITLIKNLDGLTKRKWCTQCGEFFVHLDKNCNAARDMERHLEFCKGMQKKKLVLSNKSLLYCTHITRNYCLKYLVANKHTDIFGKSLHDKSIPFNPTKGFITYDFETMEEILDTSNEQKATTILAQLKALSVAMTVKTDTEESFYFDIREENFIDKFINELFEQARIVIDYNIKNNALYQHLHKINDEVSIKKLYQKFFSVKVIGFNSARFDSHFLMQHLCTNGYSIQKSIGNAGSMKMIRVVSDKDAHKGVKLCFIDAMNFCAPGTTLKKMAHDFGGLKNLKGVFPYEVVNSVTYKEVLDSKDILPIKSFYSNLTKQGISEQDYKDYVSDMKSNDWTHWDYLKKYNVLDTQIMIPALNFMIDHNAQYGIDLLCYVSLSSYACAMKYAMAYDGFSIDGDYNKEDKSPLFKMTEEYWKKKCAGYLQQDKDRFDTSNNVSMEDYEYYKNEFENSTCAICNTRFHQAGRFRPTLDRINNKEPHTKDNCQPCCWRCNTYKANNDEKITKLNIQLENFSNYYNLPTNIAKQHEETYHLLRDSITGGLSNVLHRKNIKGETKINKFFWDKNCYKDRDTENIVTHVCGVDFNSLYPSCYSSAPHLFIKMMGYEDSKFYMPGSVIEELTDFDRIAEIIDKGKSFEHLYVVSVKGFIPEDKLQKAADFPPIIRSIETETTPDIIGRYTYDLMLKNKILKPGQVKKERKLTNLSSTMGEFMTFSNYYLQWLIDYFNFEVVDIGRMTVFSKHDRFYPFVDRMRRERVQAELNKENGKAISCKIAVNGSYGYDIMNEMNFVELKYCNSEKTLDFHRKAEFVGEVKLSNDAYQVSVDKKIYRCDTPLQIGFFTLDIAKVWYLHFIHEFLFKCLDTEKLHFAEGDTDSAYFAVAGDPEQGPEQGFTAIIKDKEFYNKYIDEFLPRRQPFDNPLDKKLDEKKLLGCCFEGAKDSMICLAPKCYCLYDEEETKMKSKGYSIKKNASITKETYLRVLGGDNEKAVNTNLQFIKGSMHRVDVLKTAVSGIHTKMIVQDNGACLPFPPKLKIID